MALKPHRSQVPQFRISQAQTPQGLQGQTDIAAFPDRGPDTANLSADALARAPHFVA